MPMRLLGAAAAVAIAMALEPTSFGLTKPQAKPTGSSAKGPTADVADVTPADSATASTQTAISASEPTADPVSDTVVPVPSATLSMVPTSPKLVARLQAMLPKDLSVQQAAVGFRNQAQFVATVQVSKNLEIPFPLLKSKVVGEGMSLGQAIKAVRPDANVSRELSRARQMTAQEQKQ
jgi:hypothetical protein